MGSSLIGSRPGIIDASLHLLLQVPHYIPDQKKFELGVLVSNKKQHYIKGSLFVIL